MPSAFLIGGATALPSPTGEPDGDVLTVASGLPTWATPAPTMVLLDEKIAPAGGSASFDFTSIPATYRHLQFFWVGRSEGAASDMYLRFNNDSGANYRLQVFRGVASGASAATLSAQTSANIGSVPASGSGYESHGRITIPYYATGAFNRTAFSEYAQFDGTNTNVGQFSAHWSSTAAISRVTFLVNAGATDFNVGSIMSLYGIR